MSEVWRSVSGFEGLYEVSSRGRVRSLPRIIKDKNGNDHTVIGRILKPQDTDNGYLTVTLCKDLTPYVRLVHRLVAAEFCFGKDERRNVVNHINGVKTDNRFENLEWCTTQENLLHAVRTGLKPPSPRRKRVMRSDGVVFDSVYEAAQRSGVGRRNLYSVLVGNRNQTGGFGFKYV